jgi:hypothetical protein
LVQAKDAGEKSSSSSSSTDDKKALLELDSEIGNGEFFFDEELL